MHVSFETSIVINLKMTFSELTLPPDTKSLKRSIEKTNSKIINTQLSLVFNKTYIYIYIIIYKLTILHDVAFYNLSNYISLRSTYLYNVTKPLDFNCRV